jgi:PAS domain S-box-containing protein
MKSKAKENIKRHVTGKHRQKNTQKKPKIAQKKNDEVHALSQDRFRALVEMTSDWIWEIDSRGVYTYVSPKVTDLLGYSVQEVLGKTFFELMPAQEAERIASIVQPIFDHAQPICNLENINVHKDGRQVVLETSGIPILDDAGNMVGYRGIDRDISDRKQMEERIIKSEHRFRSLSEASLEAIVFIEDGIIVDANDALNRLFGYEDEDLSGRPATDFIVPERRPFTDERMRTRTEGVYETLGLRKDGSTFPIEVNPREFEYEGKKLRISAVRDLTELKKTEKQLKDYQEHLEKLVQEKMHELKEREKSYEAIFDNAVVGIYQSTKDGCFLRVNSAFARIHGYDTPEELVQSISDIGTILYKDSKYRKIFIDRIEKNGIVQDFEIEVRTRDGSIKHVSLNSRAVKDESGKTLYFEGFLQDITEKKRVAEQIMLQRDLAVRLAQVHNLEEGMPLILQAALTSSGLECGGISLRNDTTGGFDLLCSINLTKNFQKKVRHVPVGSFTWSRMMEKKSFHIRPSKNLTPKAMKEGFKFISIIPMLQEDEVIGFLAAASKILTKIPEQVCLGLEVHAAESGSVIARMKARQQLMKEITARKQAEQALDAQRHNLKEANTALMEANTALKVLLKHREEDRKELEEKFLANVQNLVMPYVEKLKNSTLDPIQHMSIGSIESNLAEIISPFLHNIQRFKFTPRQLEVATLIREGRTTKDIASHLDMNKEAVDIQRFMIRKKLGLNKQKINLQSYLKSLG